MPLHLPAGRDAIAAPSPCPASPACLDPQRVGPPHLHAHSPPPPSRRRTGGAPRRGRASRAGSSTPRRRPPAAASATTLPPRPPATSAALPAATFPAAMGSKDLKDDAAVAATVTSREITKRGSAMGEHEAACRHGGGDLPKHQCKVTLLDSQPWICTPCWGGADAQQSPRVLQHALGMQPMCLMVCLCGMN